MADQDVINKLVSRAMREVNFGDSKKTLDELPTFLRGIEDKTVYQLYPELIRGLKSKGLDEGAKSACLCIKLKGNF